MLEVKNVELILENCESLPIQIKHIGNFFCENTQDSVARIACNSITKCKVCDDFFIEINHAANVSYKPFGIESEEDEMVFDRLHYAHDITGVLLTYEDGTSECIFVPWEDNKNGQDNAFQTSYVSERGDLYISVSEDTEVSEVMDECEIDIYDEDKMDYFWSTIIEDDQEDS